MRPRECHTLSFGRVNDQRIGTRSADPPPKEHRMLTRKGQPAELTVPGFAGRLTRSELDAYDAAFRTHPPGLR